jgi:hypothetical protein
MNTGDTSNINKSYLWALVFTAMIGLVNFGFCITSWNVLQFPFKLRYQLSGEWLEEGAVTKWAVYLTTA